ncbi:MAG: beta-glucosidase [Gemmatimonadota bacterium]|nr:MAG: beta-glucosidase [Gemmatimonadota bacterium]
MSPDRDVAAELNAEGRFPAGFLWGAATSAYQIEGSPLADGAGVSNWHHFTHQSGNTKDGATGDVACDHYRRYRDDVALMSDLGLQAYRFSVAWSRVLPDGRGSVNQAGVDFYSRLVDELLEHGIQPNVTLFHWDLPAALDDQGGWLHRDIVGWFADYASVMFRALGDRVPLWTTLNEPWVVVDAGYVHGVHAPGRRNAAEAPVASHHLLLAHGAAVDAYRSLGRGKIGLVVNLEPKDAASGSADDAAATNRADAYMNRFYLDPVLLGHYPEEMAALFGEDWPEFPAEDLAAIRRTIDFVGINYYTRAVVRRDDSEVPDRAAPVRQDGARYTEMDWEVHPESLTRVLRWVAERYGSPPIYVTENGAAFPDPPSAPDGTVNDPLRVDYLRTHLEAVRTAIRQGVDVRGYFAWSLLDNFEWAAGYSKRFGLVHVDFETQQRTPKASALVYRDLIRTHGAGLR